MAKGKILIYRRSHTGDPNTEGVFGCKTCMGSVRGWGFDHAIGIGGRRPWPGSENITCKITWIGIGAKKINPYDYDVDSLDPEEYDIEKIRKKELRAEWVVFKHFLLLDANGLNLKDISLELYEYMFVEGQIPRAGYCPKHLENEVLSKILILAESKPPSKGPLTGTRPKYQVNNDEACPSRSCGT